MRFVYAGTIYSTFITQIYLIWLHSHLTLYFHGVTLLVFCSWKEQHSYQIRLFFNQQKILICYNLKEFAEDKTVWSQGLFSSWNTPTSSLIHISSLGAVGKENSFALPSESLLQLRCSFAAKKTACFGDIAQADSPRGQEGVLLQVGTEVLWFVVFVHSLNT